jgi:hypothetical protein
LSSLPAGEITDTGEVERLLAGVWGELIRDDGGMEGYKLLNRMENVRWEPPVLQFQIERHGGTVLGSTRAELQHWDVDVGEGTATLRKVGHRQLSPMAKKVYIKPLVEEIVRSILNHTPDDRVSWGDGYALVHTCKIFPKGSAVNMTLEGRRKRFRQALETRLCEVGWDCSRGHGFEYCSPRTGD